MRVEAVAALALAGAVVLVVDGSPGNRGVVEALRQHAQEQQQCERQIGRDLSRLVGDRFAELEAPVMAFDILGSDPFFRETRTRLHELAGVSLIIHRACAAAHRAPRLPAHDKCSRSAVRCHA